MLLLVLNGRETDLPIKSNKLFQKEIDNRVAKSGQQSCPQFNQKHDNNFIGKSVNVSGRGYRLEIESQKVLCVNAATKPHAEHKSQVRGAAGMSWRASSVSPKSFIKGAFAHVASSEGINKYPLDKDGNMATAGKKFSEANPKARFHLIETFINIY